jgi:hypothetical protein
MAFKAPSQPVAPQSANTNTGSGTWTRTDGPRRSMTTEAIVAASWADAEDGMFLVVASGRNLAAAGVDMHRVRAVDLGKIVGAGSIGSDTEDILSRIRLAHIDVMEFSTIEAMRADSAGVRATLSALRGLALEHIDVAVQQLEATAPSTGAVPDELYQVLTAQEMADRMKLTLPVVYKREEAGELFAVLEPYRKTGRLFPAFQLDHKLNHRLLVKVIKAYADADVNTTLLWSFLRTPQRIFDKLTPIEVLVGRMPVAIGELKPEERDEAFLEVVAEELSRVRIQ